MICRYLTLRPSEGRLLQVRAWMSHRRWPTCERNQSRLSFCGPSLVGYPWSLGPSLPNGTGGQGPGGELTSLEKVKKSQRTHPTGFYPPKSGLRDDGEREERRYPQDVTRARQAELREERRAGCERSRGLARSTTRPCAGRLVCVNAAFRREISCCLEPSMERLSAWRWRRSTSLVREDSFSGLRVEERFEARGRAMWKQYEQ